ncbi:MAG: basic amino acid/polyamine antiporter, family [Gaiellaceae bacterium]|nr:basic amino acid/polyamine antiporter, family [Gaiellaceae bacterium]
MARKITGLQRVLDAPALFSVAYGEVASSIYVALGIIALHALGLTPEVLAIVGALFVLVALSYAEGTTAIPETGGAATFVRRAFNDLAGFLTGWALFLDYLIVIALSALFLPHYLGAAMRWPSLEHNPWDIVVGVGVIFGVAALRLVRRSAFYAYGIVVAVLDLLTQLLLVVLGFAFLFSGNALTHGVSIGTHPSWHQIVFALPLAMLAYTGLETVANLAEETREPGRDLPRSLFSGIGLVVLIYVAIALVALSAFPARGGTTGLGTDWLRSPLMGIVDALRGPLPNSLAAALRVYVGLTGAVILFVAVTTSISGFTRLAHSLGEHGQLPRAFGRLNRRTLVSPQAIVAAALVSTALLIGTSFVHDDVAFLASLFSFGVLAAFTAAQLAVIKLRFSEPELPRPYRTPGNVRVRGVDVPLPAVVGSLLTFAIWVAALGTHAGARYGGPAWLAAGLVVYGLVRRGRGEGLLQHVQAYSEELPESHFTSILVPMKLGAIGEEMIATAVKLAQDRAAHVEALYVIRVPLDSPLEAELDDLEEAAAASLAEARILGADYGVEVQVETVRARSIGDAIVGEAKRRGNDLIVVGSAPRWRRQSRFFSPTVEFVLRKAPCEVLVVAFPEGVMEEDGEGS